MQPWGPAPPAIRLCHRLPGENTCANGAILPMTVKIHDWLSEREGRHSTRAAFLLMLSALGLWVASLVLLPSLRNLDGTALADIGRRAMDILASAPVPTLAVLGFLIIRSKSSPRFGWLTLISSLALALFEFSLHHSDLTVLAASAPQTPVGLTTAWIQDQWMPLFLLLISLGFKFPDGRMATSRWGSIFGAEAALWLLLAFLWAFSRHPLGNAFDSILNPVSNPFGFFSSPNNWGPLGQAVFFGLLAFDLLALLFSLPLSMRARYLRADAELRVQLKWVVYGSTPVVLILVASFINNVASEEFLGSTLVASNVLSTLLQLSLLGLAACVAIAVLKYRLYDLDLVISRTLTYGGLTLLIVLGYISLISGLGVLLPRSLGMIPSIVATAILAVLFLPVRERLQRIVNQIVYGDRDRPYEVIRSLGSNLATANTPQAILDGVAKTIAKSMKLDYVSIHVQSVGGKELMTQHGSRRRTLDLPLADQGQVIGTLSVARASSAALDDDERSLLQQIALWLGPVVHAFSLTDQLRKANARMISARAEERRRLYRDLHDGMGPTLASQTFRFDQAIELLQRDPQAAERSLLRLKAETQALVQEIRRMVYGLRSSALDELGLMGSLRHAIARLNGPANKPDIALTGDPELLHDLPAAHEQAIEKIALEAITNAVRHSGADTCHVDLSVTGQPRQSLVLTVEDNGRGMPPEDPHGIGINSMIRRADALGGVLQIESIEPRGTRLIARLPLPAYGRGTEER